MAQPRVIYDFGANNGDDVAYYLHKAEVVVAVEANPVLAEQIRSRFQPEISAGRLFVENCVLTVEPAAEAVPFYIHRHNHVLSQFPKPQANILPQFDEVPLPARNVMDLIRGYGEPHYVKLDLEHYDHVVLEHLFANRVMPPYISAESHSIEVFCLLVAVGMYQAFKMVDGATVPRRYGDHPIKGLGGELNWRFPEHSAGPFGEDVDGPWMNRNNFFRLLSYAGLGWKDIHASRVDQPDPAHAPRPQFSVNMKIEF